MIKGDKIVCIDTVNFFANDNTTNITFGKVYEIIAVHLKIWVQILDDTDIRHYRKDRFKLLSEIRENKLDELCK